MRAARGAIAQRAQLPLRQRKQLATTGLGVPSKMDRIEVPPKASVNITKAVALRWRAHGRSLTRRRETRRQQTIPRFCLPAPSPRSRDARGARFPQGILQPPTRSPSSRTPPSLPAAERRGTRFMQTRPPLVEGNGLAAAGADVYAQKAQDGTSLSISLLFGPKC